MGAGAGAASTALFLRHTAQPGWAADTAAPSVRLSAAFACNAWTTLCRATALSNRDGCTDPTITAVVSSISVARFLHRPASSCPSAAGPIPARVFANTPSCFLWLKTQLVPPPVGGAASLAPCFPPGCDAPQALAAHVCLPPPPYGPSLPSGQPGIVFESERPNTVPRIRLPPRTYQKARR